MSAQKPNDAKSTATTTPAHPGQQQGSSSKEIPSLGALDEDDEFEEFEAQDWDDSETSLTHISNDKGGATGLSISGERGGTSGGDHHWEDNWDDDDVEDDFSKALRAELEKQSSSATQPMVS
ncbi:hypothetical protein CBS101457_005347 [Exobasidium rhododendri]|nr:hypothetical protein CBS101457_005347 [Exobasidium rhododendri]